MRVGWSGDVADDAAEKDEICRDGTHVGIGHRGVRGDHLDSPQDPRPARHERRTAHYAPRAQPDGPRHQPARGCLARTRLDRGPALPTLISLVSGLEQRRPARRGPTPEPPAGAGPARSPGPRSPRAMLASPRRSGRIWANAIPPPQQHRAPLLGRHDAARRSPHRRAHPRGARPLVRAQRPRGRRVGS